MIEYNSINKTTVLYIDWDFKMLQNVQVLFFRLYDMVYYQYSFESIFRSIEIRRWKIQIHSQSFYFAYIKLLSDAKTKQLFDVNGKFGSITIII